MLDAAALPELIALVQKHRVTDPAQLARIGRRGARKEGGGPGPAAAEAVSAPSLKPRSLKVRERVSKVKVQRVLNATAHRTFPERIVALTGWLQARDHDAIVRPRDIKQLLVDARVDPPANPGRDFRLAWDQGWLVRLQQREFVLSDQGWIKLAELLNDSLPPKAAQPNVEPPADA